MEYFEQNYLVFLLVFRHVDANKAFAGLLLVEISGDLLGQLSLANAARAKKEEDEGMIVIGPSVFFASNCCNHLDERIMIKIDITSVVIRSVLYGIL